MRGPIVYDTTAAPTEADLTRWAGVLGLPVRRWVLIRRLLGRIVTLGFDEYGRADWVLKAGSGDRDHAAAFAAASEHACSLAQAAGAGDAAWLDLPPLGDWRLMRDGDVSLAAIPYVEGEPLAIEHRLNQAEKECLVASIPAILTVMSGLSALTARWPNPDCSSDHPAPPFDRAAYEARLVSRTKGRLAHLVEHDGLDPGHADAVSRRFEQLIGVAPMERVLSHGELTAWHILLRPSGKLALIDLETMGLEPVGTDLTVLVMRTWALNAAPPAALAILAAARAACPPVQRDRLEASLGWQWIFAAVRTRRESMAWRERGEALSFWEWALEGQP